MLLCSRLLFIIMSNLLVSICSHYFPSPISYHSLLAIKVSTMMPCWYPSQLLQHAQLCRIYHAPLPILFPLKAYSIDHINSILQCMYVIPFYTTAVCAQKIDSTNIHPIIYMDLAYKTNHETYNLPFKNSNKKQQFFLYSHIIHNVTALLNVVLTTATATYLQNTQTKPFFTTRSNIDANKTNHLQTQQMPLRICYNISKHKGTPTKQDQKTFLEMQTSSALLSPITTPTRVVSHIIYLVHNCLQISTEHVRLCSVSDFWRRVPGYHLNCTTEQKQAVRQIWTPPT